MREFLPQITTTARIKANSSGGETLSFIVYLGPIQLVCIANIPSDGEETAPVYVKFKIDTNSRPKPARNVGPRNRNYNEQESDPGYHEEYAD